MKSFYIFMFVALYHCVSAKLVIPDFLDNLDTGSHSSQSCNCTTVQNFFVTNSQCNNEAAPDIPCDYTLVPGIGGLKLHLERKSWNEARKTCLAEGGHLAIITSKAENDLINSWRQQNGIGNDNQYGVWLGYHNLYNNNDWVSVLDQPLSASYIGWTTLIANMPDNSGGNQHCTRLIDYGMDDIECGTSYPFVCKIISSATKKTCTCPS